MNEEGKSGTGSLKRFAREKGRGTVRRCSRNVYF